MNKRWQCPQCGTGALAPSRPRRDDVRRYCFPCSTKTGRLVERTCPALERQRAANTAKRAAVTATKRQRTKTAEAARWTAGPYDMKAELRRYLKLPFLAGLRVAPDVEAPRRSSTRAHSSGHCTYARPARIVWTIGTNPHDAPGTLIHELCHAALLHEGHSNEFWRLVQRGCREAFPDVTFEFAQVRNGWQTQAEIARALEAVHAPVP